MNEVKDDSKEEFKDGESRQSLLSDKVPEYNHSESDGVDWGAIFESIKSIFVPKFNELDTGMLFLLSILALFTDPDACNELVSMLEKQDIVGYAALGLFIFWGARAFFHNFFDWKKSENTKSSMVYFASMCCGFSWIFSNFFSVNENTLSPGRIFGIFNLIQGIVLIILVRFKYMDYRHFKEGDTPLEWAIISVSLISCLFFTLREGLDYTTADTYAICVSFVMNLSGYICRKAAPIKDTVRQREESDKFN